MYNDVFIIGFEFCLESLDRNVCCCYSLLTFVIKHLKMNSYAPANFKKNLTNACNICFTWRRDSSKLNPERFMENSKRTHHLSKQVLNTIYWPVNKGETNLANQNKVIKTCYFLVFLKSKGVKQTSKNNISLCVHTKCQN